MRSFIHLWIWFVIGASLSAPAWAMPADVVAQLSAADDHPRRALTQMQRELDAAVVARDDGRIFWWSIAAARTLAKLERHADAGDSATVAAEAWGRLSAPTPDQRLWLLLARLETQNGWLDGPKLLPQVTEVRRQAEALGAASLACEARGQEAWLLTELRSDDEAWLAAESLERCGQELKSSTLSAVAHATFAKLSSRRAGDGLQASSYERHFKQAEAALGNQPARFLRSIIRWDVGLALVQEKRWQAALQSLESVRRLSLEIEDDAGVGAANLEIAHVLLGLNRPAQALPLLKDASDLLSKGSDAEGGYRAARVLELRIQALSQLRSPALPTAIEQGQRWLAGAAVSRVRVRIERAVAEGLAASGRHVAAYEMLQKSSETEAATRATARDTQMQRLQARYVSAQRDAENAALKLKEEAATMQLRAERERRQALTIALVAVAALAVLGFVFSGRELAQRRRMAAMALRDELTGQPNRRAVKAYAQEQLAQAQRLDLPFTVAMIDLDNFKQVNDRFGHATGDAVLKAFAERSSTVLRGHDRMGRWGGEEFLLVMPGTRLTEVQNVFERLSARFAEGHLAGVQAEARGTFSMGAAEMNAQTSTFEALVAAADAALYRAKAEGRNRLALAAESEV